MATYTATSFLREPRLVHAGLNSQTFRYSLGATASSVGDVILLAKLPWGTTLVDFQEEHSTGATAQLLDYGYDSTLSAFLSGATQGQINRLTVKTSVGTQFTGSDDATPRYSILKATVAAGSATTSLKLSGNIQYTFGD
jgi:hypothetical protein